MLAYDMFNAIRSRVGGDVPLTAVSENPSCAFYLFIRAPRT